MAPATYIIEVNGSWIAALNPLQHTTDKTEAMPFTASPASTGILLEPQCG